jgi:uncharacterized membrane protein YphA (DoxX/SURF4 family)
MTTETTPAAGSPKGPENKSFARYLPTVARLLMGLVFFVFGLNGFFNFIPPPKTPMSEAAMGFIGGLMKTGYMFPMIAGTQVLVGALLLTNLFVPLALALIAPVIVNIVAFHLVLEHSGTSIAIVVALLELYLAWSYREAFCSMLRPKTRPS